MFWGVTIDAGKRYSQVAEQGFHVSMAALEVSSTKPGENVQVMLHQESTEYLLCTLHNNLLQQPMDLNFATGEEVSFSLNGSGVVHLTGYLIFDDELPSMEEYSDEDDEEAPSLVDSRDAQIIAGLKRKAQEPLKKSKKIKLLDEIDDSDDDDDEDYSEEEEGFSDDDDDDDQDIDDFDSDEDDFDEDSDFGDEMDDEEETPAKINNKAATKSPKAASTPGAQKDKNKKQVGKQEVKTPKQEVKTPKQEVKTPKQQGSEKLNGKEKKQGTPTQKAPETPVTPAGDGESAKKKKKKKKKKNKDGDSSVNDSSVSTPGTPAAPTKTDSSGTPKKRVVSGGTIVEDVKVGHGPEAKPGKMVSVYYVGTLSKSNKRFDSCTEGKPFRFRLNQGEVIKGWDVGLTGMKVGGKRKITVPPSQGYGNNKQGPIPPNSTLVFEVELKAVS
ncbi:hypothetical protein Btru_027741 [Bulinus truncatus]|nr:hypothetical protein Btru_027741 [Bulinus truncatus]